MTKRVNKRKGCSDIILIADNSLYGFTEQDALKIKERTIRIKHWGN